MSTDPLYLLLLVSAALLMAARIIFALGHFYGYRKGVREMGDAAANLMSGDDANV